MKSIYKIFKIGMGALPVCLFVIITISGCKKLVAVDPPSTAITSTDAFSTNLSAIAVLNNLYASMSSSSFGNISGLPTLSLFAGLSADELTLYSGLSTSSYVNFYAVYQNAILSGPNSNVGGFGYWDYNSIYQCNNAIEKLGSAANLTPAIKQQLLGEAYFMRGFYYFYMVNLFGDLPMVLSTDYKANSSLPRTPKAQVYTQIIADLTKAQSLLSTSYLNGSLAAFTSGTVQRVRPTSWAATALLARANLYAGLYVDAETQATAVINNNSLFTLLPLNNVFLANSQETIWSLQPVTSGAITNTQDGAYFILPASGPSTSGAANPYPVYLSNFLVNAFESGDKRAVIGNWINKVTVGTTTYYYPYKYKVGSLTANAPVTENIMMLRLAEQYLIRAEVRAQQNNISGAQSDLNVIRTRAGLANTTATDKASLLSAILHERQVEFFTELGHRWLDLKRTGNVDAVMTIVTPQKGGIWQSFQQLYPIYYPDTQADPNLTQNPGY